MISYADRSSGAGELARLTLIDVAGGYGGTPVFRKASFRLYPGQFTGIVGPTGGGKTTLLKVILGLQPPLTGEVYVNGIRMDRRIPPRVGYVPQVEAVDWDFPVTVEQVVMMGQIRHRRWWPWPGRTEREQVSEILGRLGLKDFATRHIRALSGGQQQRVFLARALVSQPDLLILDEPTSGVDVKTQHDILHVLYELSRDGVTILLTTHDLNSVAAHLPWVICFNRTVIAEGSPEQTFTPAIFKRTFQADMAIFRHEESILVTQATPLNLRRNSPRKQSDRQNESGSTTNG